MKLDKLAHILDQKYKLSSQGNISGIMNDVKKALINAYQLYVNGLTAKEPILQMMVDLGEPFSKYFVREMEKTIANIDVLAESPVLLFKQVNKMLGLIQEVKDDPEKRSRNFIHDAIRANKESEKNYREKVKSKFEMVLYRLSTILLDQAKVLSVFLPKEVELSGGINNPERKQLSKDKLLNFSRTYAAGLYGLNSLMVLEKILEDNELKEKLTTLINAIDRGHIPVDGPEIIQATKEIMEAYQRKATNADQFEESR